MFFSKKNHSKLNHDQPKGGQPSHEMRVTGPDFRWFTPAKKNHCC